MESYGQDIAEPGSSNQVEGEPQMNLEDIKMQTEREQQCGDSNSPMQGASGLQGNRGVAYAPDAEGATPAGQMKNLPELEDKSSETGEPSGDKASDSIMRPSRVVGKSGLRSPGDSKMKPKGLQPKVVIFYGAFGSGKPVLVKKICEVWGYVRLHILELIDRVKKYETHPHYPEIQRCYREKVAIAPEILCDLILSAMDEFGGDKFLLDDFPQTDEEIREFITLIRPRVKLVKVFNLKCCTSTCVHRAMGHEPTCHQEHMYSVTLYRKIAAYNYQLDGIIPYFRGKDNVYVEIFAGKADSTMFQEIKHAFAEIEPDIVAPDWVEEGAPRDA